MTAMKILVVDPSELTRFRLVRQFWAIPGVCQVVDAADRSQALYLLRHLQSTLMVLDSHLPDGDPVRLIPQFKSEHKDLKIAVLSHDAAGYHRQRCLQAGADWFFDKATEFEQLLEQLRQLSDPATSRRLP